MSIYAVLLVASLLFLLASVSWRLGYQFGRWEVFTRLPRDVQKWVDDTYQKKDANLLRRQFGEDEEAWLR